jgi:MFS family permease
LTEAIEKLPLNMSIRGGASAVNMTTVTQTANDSTGFHPEKKRVRIAVALFYFSMGLCFSSWASRIPDIKTALKLSDAVFGTILFALPVGQFLMMSFSGMLVTRFGSSRVILFAFPAYAVCLTNLGLATRGWQLASGLFLFGICGNMCNISINTQGVVAERLYGRPIMSAFHGGWSIAGFCGALIGLAMMNLRVPPYLHFWIVVGTVSVIVLLNHRMLIPGKSGSTAPAAKKNIFSRPDSALVQLGAIAFCSMASEGAMFDWSGIYFKDVVKAPASLIILGYTSFMVMMATGRFVADGWVQRFGRRQVLRVSGVLISTGLFLAVLFPFITASTIAFMMVGLGVSSVVPSVYSSAGKQAGTAPGIAIATVASVGFLGFLMGPPLIGYISAAAGLRYSFAVIGFLGICISFLVSRTEAIL